MKMLGIFKKVTCILKKKKIGSIQPGNYQSASDCGFAHDMNGWRCRLPLSIYMAIQKKKTCGSAEGPILKADILHLA